jgi:cyanophycinase
MLRRTFLAIVSVLCACAVASCTSSPAAPADREVLSRDTGLRGHLLLIGGGLDDDNKPVYNRLLELAAKASDDGVPHIVIATAASFDQDSAERGKLESIRAYSPGVVLTTIKRETPTDETVRLIDEASGMFFTGGDQKRIVDRYAPRTLPAGVDSPEAAAMRRLLARGGVIAGTSAGDAMMGDIMFHTGRSAEALGIRSTRTQSGPDDDADAREIVLGPQSGPGMGFLPWAITDSHFFERNRFGRLVAALETSGQRLGIGVGEDACVEVDLATGDLVGVSVTDTLLVDVGTLVRDRDAAGATTLARRAVRASVITQGTRINLLALLRAKLPAPGLRPVTAPQLEPVVEPGQNRQLASWRFFTHAQTPDSPPRIMRLDGYDQIGWPDAVHLGVPWSAVDLEPQGAK